MKTAFDPFFLGSFPFSRIASLRNFHRQRIEAELVQRKERVQKQKARLALIIAEREKENKEIQNDSVIPAEDTSQSSSVSTTSTASSSSTSDVPVQSTTTELSLLDPKYTDRFGLFSTIASSNSDPSTTVLDSYYTSSPPLPTAPALSL